VPAGGFDFLGFHHRKRESWKRRGRHYLQKWPSNRAMAAIRGRVRERTDRRYASQPLQTVVADLNALLRGTVALATGVASGTLLR